MADKEKDLTIILRYFDLDLSDEELLFFEKRMEEDEEFAQMVRIYRESEKTVNQAYQNSDDNARIQQWRAQIEANQKPKIKNTPWLWVGGIAAAIALLFFGLQINNTSKQDFKLAVKEAWNKNIGLDYKSMRNVEKDSLKSIILTAVDSYENGKYRIAIDALQHFNNTMYYYEDALLLKGLSYYKNGKLKKAILTLDTLANYPTQRKAKTAKWYQGLIYLELDQLDKAKEFITISNNGNSVIQLKE